MKAVLSKKGKYKTTQWLMVYNENKKLKGYVDEIIFHYKIHLN